MSHIPYTICRSGTYYYNRRVPRHAVLAYGSFIRHSLSPDPVAAELYGGHWGVLWQRLLSGSNEKVAREGYGEAHLIWTCHGLSSLAFLGAHIIRLLVVLSTTFVQAQLVMMVLVRTLKSTSVRSGTVIGWSDTGG